MTNKAHYPGMGIENLVNSGELQNGQSRAKVAKATRCNDQFYGTYAQVSGSARHPERMMIWSALYGNIQLGINPGVGLTNQLEHKGYGALANGYFRHHRTKDAEAITIQGQQAVRYLAKRISHFISALVGETVSPDEIYVYGDTDSVTGDTLVWVNGRQMSIAELFNTAETVVETSRNGNMVKRCDNMITKTVTDQLELVDRKIKYVMAHRVEKRMFKVRVGCKEVVITQDHSLIVLREDRLISCAPADVQNGDRLISVSEGFETLEQHSEFEIVDLGIQEMVVYDIEVKDTHRFFANDILVHNSAYFTIEAIVEKYKDRIPPEKLVDFLDKFIETKIQPEINATFDDLADYMNCFQNKMGAKREAIASSGVFCVHPETSISVNGEPVAIETLFNESDGDSDVRKVRDKSVLSYNESTQQIERDDIQLVVRKWYEGDMYTITTPNQNVIRITADHLVLVKRGVDLVWVAAKELLESDTVLEV